MKTCYICNQQFDGTASRCKPCNKAYMADYYQKNQNRMKENSKRYRKENPDYYKTYNNEYYQSNRESLDLANKEWAKNNKEALKAIKHKYYYSERGLVQNKEKANYRRAAKKMATPSWVCRESLRQIYKNCPPGYHVDHIIPLSHPLVCGLHVPWNLQYLPAEENLKKSNKIKELSCQTI